MMRSIQMINVTTILEQVESVLNRKNIEFMQMSVSEDVIKEMQLIGFLSESDLVKKINKEEECQS